MTQNKNTIEVDKNKLVEVLTYLCIMGGINRESPTNAGRIYIPVSFYGLGELGVEHHYTTTEVEELVIRECMKFVDRQPFMDNTINEKLLNELLERKKLEEK